MFRPGGKADAVYLIFQQFLAETAIGRAVFLLRNSHAQRNLMHKVSSKLRPGLVGFEKPSKRSHGSYSPFLPVNFQGYLNPLIAVSVHVSLYIFVAHL